MDQNTKINLQYFAQLDGLRALAIIMVILFHWQGLFWHLPFGWIGVQIFFMLSGFLITRILIQAKAEPFNHFIMHFYKRRALRIFPLYFSYLLFSFTFLWALHFWGIGQVFWHEVKRNWLFLITYTYNFQELYNGLTSGNYFGTAFYSNLWSLSVEEQFYLLFPLLVYFLPLRKLKLSLIFLILLPTFLRFISLPFFVDFHSVQWAGFLQYRLLPFHTDSLCLGALLAISNFTFIKKPFRWLIFSSLIFVLSGLLFIVYHSHLNIFTLKSLGFGTPTEYVEDYRYLYAFMLINACAFFLILHILRGGKIPLFHNGFIRYIGKISYGIYIFHGPLLLPVNAILYRIKTGSYFSDFLLESAVLLLFLTCLIGISYFSYKYFESYFLKMR